MLNSNKTLSDVESASKGNGTFIKRSKDIIYNFEKDCGV